jgi:CDP-paratose 2-epimerase
MSFLVTGGCGFVGSNLAAALLRDGENVTILDNLSRVGSELNLEWLRSCGNLEFVRGDVREPDGLESLFRRGSIECIFHLAGQVAMTTSLASPRQDFEINVAGSINILELARVHAPEATIVYASSNKVYGDLENFGLHGGSTRYTPSSGSTSIDESAALDFRTPYGCSKGAADQYMLDYARSFGLRSVVFRHSTIYGGRQISTFDQGWVGWFCQQALMTARNSEHRFTINGDGKQVRDLLYVTDAVQCYRSAHHHIDKAAGQAFNIGGGIENSMSLLELFADLERRLKVKLHYDSLPWRLSDQKYFVADNSKARRLLHWNPTISKEAGVEATLDWERERSKTPSR